MTLITTVVEKKEIRKVSVASKTQSIVFMMSALDVVVLLSSRWADKAWPTWSTREYEGQRPIFSQLLSTTAPAFYLPLIAEGESRFFPRFIRSGA